MAAAYSQKSPYDTINQVLTFSNSLLATVGPVQCLPAEHNTKQTVYIHNVCTVQSGLGNCMTSTTAVEGSVCLNTVEHISFFMYR